MYFSCLCLVFQLVDAILRGRSAQFAKKLEDNVTANQMWLVAAVILVHLSLMGLVQMAASVSSVLYP